MTTQPNKKAILALSSGHFVADMFASALVPLYPLIASALGIKLAAISLVLSIGHLSSSAMQPLFGFIADQSKHRTFMIWGLILGSIFIPLAVGVPNAYLLAICLILGMCGNSLFHPQATIMINVFNYQSPDIGKFMGFFLGMGTIGYAISPACSSFVVGRFGPHGIFYMTIIGLLAALLTYLYVPKVPFKAARRSKESFGEIMLEIAKTPELIRLIVISVMKSIVTISFATYMPFLLKSHGWSLAQVGLIMTCFFTFAGIATVTSSKIESWLGSTKVIMLSFFAIFPMSLLFLLLLKSHPLLAILIFILEGFFVFLSVSVTMCAAQKLMPEHKGVVSGAVGGFSWAIAAFALVPLGYIAENVGIGKILLLIGAIAFLIGLFGVDGRLRKLLDSVQTPCDF